MHMHNTSAVVYFNYACLAIGVQCTKTYIIIGYNYVSVSP